MPFTYNDRHDLQEEERRHQEARLAQTLTRIASQPTAQSSTQQHQRRHPDNVREIHD
jgi:hypothetical protein